MLKIPVITPHNLECTLRIAIKDQIREANRKNSSRSSSSKQACTLTLSDFEVLT